eukprot:g4236.t1
MDMSGVSWNDSRTATLITPRHVVMAKHYSRGPAAAVIFHDRSGKRIERKLIAFQPALGDVMVGLLDEPVPSNYTAYPLPSPYTDISRLPGRRVIVSDKDKNLFVHKIRLVGPGKITFEQDEEDLHGWGKNLIAGDSGNPSFLIVGDQLVLIETHTTGGAGAGPYYGDGDLQASIRRAVSKLDPSYDIRTITLALEALGNKTGAFQAVISDDLSNFEKDKISEFDAICFLSTTSNAFAPNKQELKKMSAAEKKAAAKYELALKESLMDFVKSGGGFIGIHSATDTFYEWEEYGEMINGQFDGHPWRAQDNVHIMVEPGMEEHPLAEMFEGKPLEFKEEIYQHKAPYDSSKVEMLLRLDPEKSEKNVKGINRTDNDFGVSWARNWENGRVFYCSLGHNHDMFWRPTILQHYLAGIQWAIGDYQVELSEGK